MADTMDVMMEFEDRIREWIRTEDSPKEGLKNLIAEITSMDGLETLLEPRMTASQVAEALAVRAEGMGAKGEVMESLAQIDPEGNHSLLDVIASYLQM